MKTTPDKRATKLPPLTPDEGRLLRLMQNRKSAKHARKRKPTARRATPPSRRAAILCPTCNQDMTQAPHGGPIDCPQCGQGIRRKPTDQLTRLVAKWRREADAVEKRWYGTTDSGQRNIWQSNYMTLRCCADDLERLLKL